MAEKRDDEETLARVVETTEDVEAETVVGYVEEPSTGSGARYGGCSSTPNTAARESGRSCSNR